MRFRIVPRIFLTLAFVATAVSSLAAQESATVKRIVENGEFRVGMSGSQPPFTVKARDGRLIGYEVELAGMLADAMGVELELVEKPFSQLLPALESGEIDAIMSGMTITTQRNLKVAFIGPYILSGKSILTKSSTLAAIREAGEMNQSTLRLVALEGSTSQSFVQENAPNANLTTTADYDAAVQLVLDDQVDAMVADFPICAISVMRHPNAGLTTLAQPLTLEPIGMALPPGDPLLLNMVQNYFSSLQLTGVLTRLEEKWFKDGSWLIQIP